MSNIPLGAIFSIVMLVCGTVLVSTEHVFLGIMLIIGGVLNASE